MAQVQGVGTTWNLPNYAGELFTADPTQTPFLSMIGGLTGGRQTSNFEFPTAVLYDFPPAGQPEISEMDSAIAPKASHIAREQEKNVVQIHQEVIDLTYAKQSNSGRMSGLNTSGQQANPPDIKLLFWRLGHIVENGTYTYSVGLHNGNNKKCSKSQVFKLSEFQGDSQKSYDVCCYCCGGGHRQAYE